VHPYTQALIAAIPAPDPDRHLDFARLMQGRASDPSSWPEPFRRIPGNPARTFEVEPGHWVEANAPPEMARMREASLVAT
jgi:peptide/nickel transport system ATP-binding protein